MSSTVTYKCPNCDAGLVFDAEKQRFACEFCLSSFTEDELDGTEAAKRSEKEEQDDREFSDQMREYHCSNCGAEVVVDTSTVADYCYYCHNPIVISDRVSGVHKPAKIVPFRFDKQEAKDTFLRYAKKKWFVPRDYFSAEQSDKISGIYYPFWVVDADARGDYTATGSKVRTWRQGDYRYTETSRFAVRRGGDLHFEDITACAISSEDKAMLEGILPYPMNEHEDFSIPYLQGYMAKKRDIERDSLSTEVRGKMCDYATQMFSETVHGYSSVTGEGTDVNVINSHWDYTLMPIWILNYKRKEKNYIYAMNGTTGKIYGELPVSIPKLALLFSAFAAIAALITFLIGWGIIS